MKILIIGGSGVIGFKSLKLLNNSIEFTYFKNKPTAMRGIYLDITKYDETQSIIEKTKPDIVIHSSALTNVDLCETDHNLADVINVSGTKNVVNACKKYKNKIVYISTSFVFDGRKNQYTENDERSPSTYYGLTKSKGEEIVMDSGLPHLILRTDQPYDWVEKWQHTNSVLRVLDALKHKREFREIVDWRNNPTYVPEFVMALKKLIEIDSAGIFHVVGSDFVSRYEWALEIADIFNLDRKLIIPTNASELDLPAKRKNVNLNNKKLFLETKILMSGIRSGLIKMRDKFPSSL